MANGNLRKVSQYIQAATENHSDFIFWAEYVNHDDLEQPTKIRDLDKAFKVTECSTNTELVEFKYEIWNSWILEGYKFIRYRRIDGNTVALKPYKEVDHEIDLNDDVCFFGIREDEVSEWADNDIDLLEDFRFYVEAGFEE